MIEEASNLVLCGSFTFLGLSKIELSDDPFLVTFTENVVALLFHHSMYFFPCCPAKKRKKMAKYFFLKRERNK